MSAQKLPPFRGGEDVAWDFAKVTKRDRRYLFFAVSPRPYDSSPIEQRLKEDLTTFGAHLGEYGAVVRTYPERADVQRRYFIDEKAWPEAIRKRMDGSVDPFVVVIDRSYMDFDPGQHGWGVIWLSDYEPGTLYRVFSRLAQATRDDEDLFARLREHAATSTLKKVGRAISGALEVKPGIFGVALDVNALLDPALGQSGLGAE